MKTIRTWWNYDHTKNKHEIIPGDSMTVPDGSIQIKTLVEQFTRGFEIPTLPDSVGYENPDDVPDIPDIEKMDKLEKLDYARQLKEEVEEKVKTIKKRDTEIKTRAAAAAAAAAALVDQPDEETKS